MGIFLFCYDPSKQRERTRAKIIIVRPDALDELDARPYFTWVSGATGLLRWRRVRPFAGRLAINC
jgi:hypothetical protein